MAKRRLFAAATALILAGLGAVMLMSYVKGADKRAMAGMETIQVLTASAVIPEGTSGETLTELVTTKTLPVTAAATGTVASLEQIRGQVATTDLQPGEQLLASRFVDPATLKVPGSVDVPKGMQQVSVSIERPRMLGNLLTPGTTVGLFVSLAKEGKAPAQTRMVLHKVLVTKVGEAPTGSPEVEGSEPAKAVTVTFAVNALNAEKIIFGAEHGRLWLSLEPANASTTGTRVVTAENLNK